VGFVAQLVNSPSLGIEKCFEMKFRRIVILLIIPVSCFSQGVDNMWLLGSNYGNGVATIDFYQGYPNIYSSSWDMNFAETFSSISDQDGDLLFYTNGIYIADATNDTMQNGSGLNYGLCNQQNALSGQHIVQGTLILQLPGDTSVYYLLHETCNKNNPNYDPSELFYSIIDMKLNGGLGAVTSKNNILINDTLKSGNIVACRHGNGSDWWILVHRANSDLYYKLLFTKWGLQVIGTQHTGSVTDHYAYGQSVFSRDGTKFATSDMGSFLNIFDFDRCTGNLSNFIYVPQADTVHYAGGLSFSSNSRFLYYSEGINEYQYDMQATNISASQILLGTYDGFNSPLYTTFFLSQLASDGKIYINTGGFANVLHVINYPDSIGTACSFVQHGIQLPVWNVYTIPNFPNYRLGAVLEPGCDSLVTAQEPITKEVYFSVYPNPVLADNVTFTYTVSSETGSVCIYNIEGKEVAHYIIPQWSSVQHLKLPKMTGGVYMARLTQGNAVANTKFLKE